MIRHIVLFKLKDGLTREDPRVQAVSSALTELGPTLAAVLHWETRWCFGSRPVSNDFALICDITKNKKEMKKSLRTIQKSKIKIKILK